MPIARCMCARRSDATRPDTYPSFICLSIHQPSSIMTKPVPFTLHVADSDIADLKARLARTRFPDSAPGEASNNPWAYGTDVAYLRGLVEYWRDGFDWRAEE